MKRILVATDFSTRSDRALSRAVLIGHARGAALTLVHVVDDDQPPRLVEGQRSAAVDLLEQTVRSIVEITHVAADLIVRVGDPFAGIIETADEIEPDLIVVGPHRRQLLDIFVGTTAERTVRRSRRPVLMANGVPSGPYGRTLLALDLDYASRAAVEGSQRLGLADRTEVIALHLFDAPAAGMMKRSMESSDVIEDYLAEEEERAGATFRSFLAAAGLHAARQLLRPAQSSPAGAILSAAEEQKADLVVIGTSQRKGLNRLFLGSVAQEVLRDATADVLVVPVASEVAGAVPI